MSRVLRFSPEDAEQTGRMYFLFVNILDILCH